MTPVHVGTGEVKMSFEYKQRQNYIYNYDINQLFFSLPKNRLLDKKFLYNLSSNQDGSKVKYINQTLSQYVNYNQLKCNYKLKCNFSHMPNKNIKEQIKALNKPIIPGSTLKGAIINTICYDMLKKHKESFYRIIQRDYKYIRSLDDVFKKIYRDDKDKFGEFFKALKSCVLCNDIEFNDLILLQSDRYHVLSDKSEIPLPNVECLDEKQYSINQAIIFDKERIEILKHLYGDLPYYNELRNYLRYKKLEEVANNYFRDMLSEELEVNQNGGFYDYNELGDLLKSLKNKKIEKGFYLRIGGNTNYFFKTVSYLVKKDDPKLYKDYFYEIFSPKKKPKFKGAYPKANEMPATRVLYYDDDYIYYPGVIKIEYIV